MGSFPLCYSHLLRLLFRAPMAKNNMEWREGLWVCSQWVLCCAQWNGEFDTDKCVLIKKKKTNKPKKQTIGLEDGIGRASPFQNAFVYSARNETDRKMRSPNWPWNDTNLRNDPQLISGMEWYPWTTTRAKCIKMNKTFTYNLYSLTLSVILYWRKLGLHFKRDLESISYYQLITKSCQN